MSSAKVVVTTEYEISKPGRLSRECTITATRCVSGDGTLSYATQSIVTRYTDLDSFLRHSGQAHVLSNALQARLDANARLTREINLDVRAVLETLKRDGEAWLRLSQSDAIALETARPPGAVVERLAELLGNNAEIVHCAYGQDGGIRVSLVKAD
jgi:hypothetical protein